MKLITRQTKAANAAKAWDLQYPEPNEWQLEVSEALHKLGPNPEPDDVDRVTGNQSWTMLDACDECGDEVHTIMFSHAYDFVFVCEPCLRKALTLIEDP